MVPLNNCECPRMRCITEFKPICATCGPSVELFTNECQLRASSCNFTKSNIKSIHIFFLQNKNKTFFSSLIHFNFYRFSAGRPEILHKSI